MAASVTILGSGSTFGYCTTSMGTYTNLAEATKISFPKTKVQKVKVTHMLSPSGWEEYIGGLKDAGEVTVTLNYVKTQVAALIAQQGINQYFKITLGDGSTIAFQGFIDEFGGEIPVDKQISNDVSCVVTGPVTFTAGS